MNDETVIVNDLDTECFPEENLQHFVEVDAALCTTEEPKEEEIVNFILNPNANENEQADNETEEIVYNVSNFSEVHFSINQVRTFVSLNNDINTPEISITLKNIADYVEKSFCSSYRQSSRTDYFSKK
uniref:Uncharacterized protein n=1 Tax=Sipha flava TaxID=143950 RepID=A0A2S2R2P8_9HEMI